MTSSVTKGLWDGNAVKEQLCKSLANAEDAQARLGEQLSKSSPDFYHLCLAELDAGHNILRSECFETRATFLAGLRRLISEPTSPSRPVQSLQAYREKQKYWLEQLIKNYE